MKPLTVPLFLYISLSSACGIDKTYPDTPDCPEATAAGTSVWATQVPLGRPYSAIVILDPGGELEAAAGDEIRDGIEEHFNFGVLWRTEESPRIDTLYRLSMLPSEPGCPGVVENMAAIRDTTLIASWATDDGCHRDLEVAGRLPERYTDWQQVLDWATERHPTVAADLAVSSIRGAIEAITVPYGQVVAIVDGVYYEPVRCEAPQWRDRGPWRAGDHVCFLGGKPASYRWLLALRDEPLE